MRIIFVFILSALVSFASAQSISELKDQLLDATDNNEKANLENSIAEGYMGKGSYSNAIDFAEDAIDHAEKASNKGEELRGNINGGNAAKKSKKYKDAIAFYKDAADLAKSSGQKNLVAYSYESIGFAYSKLDKANESTKYYEKCLEVDNYSGKKEAAVHKSIAYNYYLEGDIKEALDAYKNADKLYKSDSDPASHSRMLINMGNVYAQYGDLEKAISTLTRASKMAKDNGDNSTHKAAEKAIESISKNKSNKENQISDFDEDKIKENENYISDIERSNMKSLDEIENLSIENQVKELKILNSQNELLLQEQKAKEAEQALATKELENAKTSAELTASESKLAVVAAEGAKTMAWLMGAGIALILVMVLALMAARNNKKLKLKNVQIAAQNSELDKKNKNITESINYARKIQNALLASNLVLANEFQEHLMFAKPRDIVSGDFSWCDSNGTDTVIALADCTGHGVPGALMSVLAISSLEKIVKQQGARNPAKVLALLNNDLHSLFGHNKTSIELNDVGKEALVKDGMDIVVIRINKATKKLSFAGSRNTMIKISGGELEELKGSKSHLGYHQGHEDFNEQEMTLKSGDAVYLFSDGFYDQKGGEEGKKFYPKRFRDMLIKHGDESMKDQHTSYEKVLANWSKGQEQIDDILVLGVRV